MKAVTWWFADDRESESCKAFSIHIHTSTSPAAGRPKVRFRNLSHKCKTDLSFNQRKNPPFLPRTGLCRSTLALFLMNFISSNSAHAKSMNAHYLHRIHQLQVWVQGCSRLLDLLVQKVIPKALISSCSALVSGSDSLKRPCESMCATAESAATLRLSGLQLAGAWDTLKSLTEILHTRNESYMYLVIVPRADVFTNINPEHKEGLVWEDDTGWYRHLLAECLIPKNTIIGPIIPSISNRSIVYLNSPSDITSSL